MSLSFASQERMYQIIQRPLVTEKSMNQDESKLTFVVPLDASKPEIKLAIETIYKVDVVKVNTILTKGKTKRFRGYLGKRNDYKKAIVTLAKGQQVDLMTGV